MPNKKRIQVYADEETKRRMELAAVKEDVSVTEYCLRAIIEQLDQDDMLDRDRIEIAVKPSADDSLIADLRALRRRIEARRGGKPIGPDVVQQTREERDRELIGMR